MTRRVAPQEQGELQGAIGSLLGLAALVGPVIFTAAFAAGIARGLPGAAWYLGAVLVTAAVLPVLRESAPDDPAPAQSPEPQMPPANAAEGPVI